MLRKLQVVRHFVSNDFFLIVRVKIDKKILDLSKIIIMQNCL